MQSLPTGVDRIDGELSSRAHATPSGWGGLAVAVIDTGSGPHPDLNVVGGIDCTVPPGTPGASVGVPLGPMIVVAPFDETGKPLGPTGVCAAWARERSVEDGTRARPSVPTSVVFGLTGFTATLGFTTLGLSAPP